MSQPYTDVLLGDNIRYSGDQRTYHWMVPADLNKLEKSIRKLAKSRGSLTAMTALHLRSSWLKRLINYLYESTTESTLEELSESEASEYRESLKRMQADLTKVSESIPFDKKLPVHLRPLTSTFQSIFMLNNATMAAIAALTLKLEGEIAVDLTGISLSNEEILDIRERMLQYAPGWASKEMGLYDQL